MKKAKLKRHVIRLSKAKKPEKRRPSDPHVPSVPGALSLFRQAVNGLTGITSEDEKLSEKFDIELALVDNPDRRAILLHDERERWLRKQNRADSLLLLFTRDERIAPVLIDLYKNVQQERVKQEEVDEILSHTVVEGVYGVMKRLRKLAGRKIKPHRAL